MDGIDGELSSLVHIRPWRHPSHAPTVRLETSSQQKKGLARRFENAIVQSTEYRVKYSGGNLQAWSASGTSVFFFALLDYLSYHLIPPGTILALRRSHHSRSREACLDRVVVRTLPLHFVHSSCSLDPRRFHLNPVSVASPD